MMGRVLTERPVNVCVATPHTVDVDPAVSGASYAFADCAAILDITSAAFPTGLKQDPAVDLVDKDFKPRSDEDKRLHDFCELFPLSRLIILIDRWGT